jgi:hypothetical protein
MTKNAGVQDPERYRDSFICLFSKGPIEYSAGWNDPADAAAIEAYAEPLTKVFDVDPTQNGNFSTYKKILTRLQVEKRIAIAGRKKPTMAEITTAADVGAMAVRHIHKHIRRERYRSLERARTKAYCYRVLLFVQRCVNF